MQFVAHGPDIPDALLQAHEAGRVVFFYGAGISYPAGLPGFEGLVRQLYERVGERQDDIEQESFKAKQFDRTLGHFESRVQGGERFRHGRVLLASHLIALFRVDRPWTETHLLPLFDWDRSSVEAKAAWEGFLWSPKLYRPLLIALKSQFISTANHYKSLGEHSRQFAAILTHAALEPVEDYSPDDFQAAIGALPQHGLNEVARALSQALESAADQREDYWRNRVQPFWHRVWPKSRDLASNSIGESLAQLCIAAGSEFPTALSAVVDWLRPIEHPQYVVHLLEESGQCGRCPDAALRLLDAILSDETWALSEPGQCLDAIAQAMPGLRQDHRYKRLAEYARRRGS